MGADWRETLFARRRLGVRPGVEPLVAVLEARHPGLCSAPPFTVTQVVGTNGKGSTAAMLAHALRGRGRGPVGLFTSPHLHRIGERIQIDGAPVSDELIRVEVDALARVEATLDTPTLSFFEVLTAIALSHFLSAGCRHVILEAGLGGRFDATSAVCSQLTVITRIGLDHQTILGDTLAAIAEEKAAVMRPRVPAITTAQEASAASVIHERARERGATLILAPPSTRAPASLPGDHQRHNAGLALAALAQLLDELDPAPRIEEIDRVFWPGRLEHLEGGELCLDVAHNLPGVEALTASLAARGVDVHVFVFGAKGDKDSAAMARHLGARAPVWHVRVGEGRAPVPPDSARSFDSPDAPELRGALREALSRARERGRCVVVCGSHALVGPLRAWALELDPAGLDDPRLSDPVPRGP